MTQESLQDEQIGAASPRVLETLPLGALGVEVRGLDLRESISEEVWAALSETVRREGLVLLRGQPLTPEQQIAVGQRFGPLEQLDVNAGEGAPALAVLSNLDGDGRLRAADDPIMKLVSINEGWHTDSSFREIPAAFSVFTCVVAPAEGGDTFFVSLRRAWLDLSDSEREALRDLDGVHDYAAAYRARGNATGEAVGFDDPAVVHPIARRHPETGDTVLYLSEHVNRIVGLPDAEGRLLIQRLLAHITASDRIHRHRWSVGDVLIWDNRSMLHRAQGFDPRHARVMHHVRVAGTEPVLRADH
jgi:alpha-ketoglutarate-dependent taurine dioxygenase